MRTNGRGLRRAGGIFLLLTTTACTGETVEDPRTWPDPTLEVPEEVIDAPALVGDPVNDPVPITLEAVNQSGVEGRAVAIHSGDSVQVNVMVQGLPGGGEYPAQIHRGTCGSGAGLAVTLTPVGAEADGMGRSTTTISAERLSPDGAYFVQVSGSGGVLACGEAEGHGPPP